jgi:hypothetical protein
MEKLQEILTEIKALAYQNMSKALADDLLNLIGEYAMENRLLVINAAEESILAKISELLENSPK